MSETRDDLREALARYIIGPRCPVPPTSKFTLAELQEVTWRRATSQEAGNARWVAERMLSGPLAPILAQVSALQAEVERLNGLLAPFVAYAKAHQHSMWGAGEIGGVIGPDGLRCAIRDSDLMALLEAPSNPLAETKEGSER